MAGINPAEVSAILKEQLSGLKTEAELEEAIYQLSKAGDIFKPKKGFLQRL